MTVLPFPGRLVTSASGAGTPVSRAALAGTFAAPSGGRGSFTGTYRLERLLTQFEQLAAVGVFTGELREADGTHIGICSRRLTCAAVVGADAVVPRVQIGPVDVNLLGFMVTVAEFSVGVRRELRDTSSAAGGSLGELPRYHRPRP
jgi:hypothetical protein